MCSSRRKCCPKLLVPSMSVSIGAIRIPPPSSADSPDISIVLHSHDQQLSIVFTSIYHGVHGHLRLGVEENAFRDFSRRLTTRLERLLTNPHGYDVLLDDLLTESASVFAQVLRGPEARSLIELLQSDPCSIHFFSNKSLVFPWDLLLVPASNRLGRPTELLGLRHAISIMPSNQNRSFKAPTPTDHPILTGVLLDMALDAVRDREAKYFARLDNVGIISKSKEPDFHLLTEKNTQHRVLIEFLLCNHRVLHLAGHSPDVISTSDNVKMRVSNGFEIDVRLLDVFFEDEQNPRIPLMPLVFLNGCGTGAYDAASSVSMAKRFFTFGAGGVIATLCKVGDLAAYQFCREFYSHALRGNTIGNSMLYARRRRWETDHDLTGLAYTLFCMGKARIRKLIGASL